MTHSALAQAATRVARSVPRSCHVYTPADLADAIVKLMGDASSARWLEPCVGGGAFLSALNRLGVPRARVRGLDLVDLSTPRDAHGRVIRGTDFLAWSRRTDEMFDRIVANPPYARLADCSKKIRREARALDSPTGALIPGTANLWYAFIAAALTRLDSGGHLGFVLPAAFEYANYCQELRRRLRSLFEQTLVFRCTTSLFNEPPVNGGAVVLMGFRYVGDSKRRNRGTFVRREVTNTAEMVRALERARVTPIGIGVSSDQHRAIVLDPEPQPDAALPLGTIANISIGAVTGDSGYFLMAESQRLALGLPRSACIAVITRRRHLAGGDLDRAAWGALRDAGERVWLFRPTAKGRQSLAIRSYLALDAASGGCNRDAFKVTIRDPWYQVLIPDGTQALLSPAVTGAPFVALVSSGIVCTNSLYSLRFKAKLTKNQQAAVLLSLYRPAAVSFVLAASRRYIGGLHKLEPNDFAAVPAMQPSGRCDGARIALRKTMKHMGRGEVAKARLIAESWFKDDRAPRSISDAAPGRARISLWR